MRVRQIMQSFPIFVQSGAPIKDVVRIIFNQRIDAVLVCKGKKLIGIITEEDILQRLFPSVKDFIDDPNLSLNEDYLDEQFTELMSNPVNTIMTENPVTITPDSTLMRAQSKMLINYYTHLPVVNAEGELTGIISQGDIFKALVGEDVPYDTEGEFHDWLSAHYDKMFEKIKRYETDADSIARIYRSLNVKRVLDVGCGTGGHAIELVHQGFEVWGVEKSEKMVRRFKEKIKLLSPADASKVNGIHAERYRDELSKIEGRFDALQFLGNALPQVGKSYRETLEAAVEKLRKNNAVVIVQLNNFNRIITKKRRLQFFDIFKSDKIKDREYAFTIFLDEAKENSQELRMNMVILTNNGKRWVSTSINSLPLYNITYTDVEKILRKHGFTDIQVFGSGWGEPLFVKPYDESQSHWVNIVAKR